MEPARRLRCNYVRMDLREGIVLEDVGVLVERARRGDAKAYEALVFRYWEAAFRTAVVITGDTEEAEDAAQEAFIKAHRALDTFREGSSFGPWLLSIVANDAKNRRRAFGRRKALALRASEDIRPEDPSDSPSASLLTTEKHETLLEAINTLREKDRLVITCRYLLELSEEETAAALGCAKGTVKSRLSRAMKRLRKRMDEKR